MRKRRKKKYTIRKERKYKNNEEKLHAVTTATNIRRPCTVKSELRANAHKKVKVNITLKVKVKVKQIVIQHLENSNLRVIKRTRALVSNRRSSKPRLG